MIWAAGEFQYPRMEGMPGAEHCLHTAMVERYDDLDGDDFIVIGGYESGIDAAYHLAKRGSAFSFSIVAVRERARPRIRVSRSRPSHSSA